jgi:tetratricopeptide (TPR) repeat protein
VERNRNRTKTYIIAASLAVITLLVYLPVLRNGFVNWDDDRYIFENLHIRSLDAGFLRWAFLDFYASNWHPLTWFSHAIDYAIWGLNPLGHHLTSIILHAINTGLVVLVVASLLQSARERTVLRSSACFPDDQAILIAAGMTGLLFGIHPVHVESVAWVMERKDLLCALFFLLSIMSYGKATSHSGQGTEQTRLKFGALVPSLVFFLLALLSKPMAVTLPVVLLILDWYPFQRIGTLKALWSAGVEKIPFFGLSLASSLITILAQGSGGAIQSLDVIPFTTRLLVAMRSLLAYVGKMLLPIDLLPYYPYPVKVSLVSPEYMLSIGLVFGITAACVALAGKQKVWLSAWGYYVVTLIPVLGIIQVGGQSMADRYTYLPSLGPFLVAGVMTASVLARIKIGKPYRIGEFLRSSTAAVIIVLPLSYLTVQQIRVWHDSISLWNKVLEKEPEVNIAAVNRGIAYMKLGRFDRALDDLSRVLERRPDEKAFYNRAILYTKLGLLAQATDDYSSAIVVDPQFYDAYNNRGVLFAKQGQLDRAFSDYTEAISLRPSSIKAYVNRGLLFDQTGRIDLALADFDKAIALDPGSVDAYYDRGLLLLNRFERYDRALADLDRAVLLNPGDPDAHYHRGRALHATGQNEKALADFNSVIALDPSYYQAYRERAKAYQGIGQLDKAAHDFEVWKEHVARQ